MTTKKKEALEALQFLDSLLTKIAGSRTDHVAIQGAVGLISAALGGN